MNKKTQLIKTCEIQLKHCLKELIPINTHIKKILNQYHSFPLYETRKRENETERKQKKEHNKY